MKPVTLITGASAGIGAALARICAEHGEELVLLARREPLLAALAEEIAAAGRPRPHILPVDLLAPGACDRVAQFLSQRGLEPATIVNNAGFGRVGMADTIPLADQLAMIDLNIRVLTEFSLRWAEALVRRQGGILNVGSIAGFLPGPGLAAYHASKAYVLSFTEALHAELRGRGVRVTALCPGPVQTEFFDRAGIPDGYFPKSFEMPVETVARRGYDALKRGQRVVTPGWRNTMVRLFTGLVPRSIVLAFEMRRHETHMAEAETHSTPSG